MVFAIVPTEPARLIAADFASSSVSVFYSAAIVDLSEHVSLCSLISTVDRCIVN